TPSTQVHPLSLHDALPIFLFLEFQPSQLQLIRQCPLISRLQQAGSQITMHFDGRADDLFSQLINLRIHSSELCVLCVRALFSLWQKTQSVGVCLPQVCAASYALATASSSASLKGWPINCRPIGRPPAVKPHGTLMPGRPARFTPMV